jgi:tetratricopeptide (TPR) repeat protein
MAEMVDNSEEAIQKYDQAIELDQDNLLYRISKASLQRAQYQYSEAKSTLIDVLPLLGYAKTVDLPMFIYNELGELERELGGVESAISWYQKSLTVALSLDPIPQEALLPLYNNLGLMNLKLGNYDQSQSYFEKALLLTDIPLESYDIYQWQLSGWSTTLINISSLQVSLGLLDEADDTLTRALERYNEILEPDIRASRYLGLKLTILQKQSNVLQLLGKIDQAQVVRLQALEQTKKLYGATHNQVALALGELGAYAIALGRVAQAVKYYQQALAVFAALGDTDSQVYMQIQQSYANLLFLQEHSDLTIPEQ